MTTLQEALPCPFCGKQHTLQVISGQELMGEDQEFWQHSESFGVVCDASSPDGKGGCGAMGGFKPTEDEAIEAWNTRSALAQQVEQQPVAWYEYNQDLDAWFLAYGHNPKAKTRPLVFGDTAAPAPQAQQMEPTDDQLVKGVKAMRLFVTKNSVADFKLGYMAALAAAPAPQAQDKSDNYLSGYCTGRTDLLKEQSAQPVAPHEGGKQGGKQQLPPLQPVAQPLTLEQILDIVKKLDETPDMSHVDVLKTFARAIESAHGIREVK